MSDILYEVQIGGQDISSDLSPILEEITVFDGTDSEADTATITVSDIEGQTFMSDERDPVSIKLGTRAQGIGLVFEGYVADVRSRGSRSAGRTLSIECSSVDPGGKAKEEQEQHWDDQTVGAILEEAFKPTGLPILVAPSFANIVRAYESMDAESPLAFARRIAEEVGGTFKAMGKRFVLAERDAGMGVDGAALPTIEAAWGRNLIDWDLTPIVPKSKYAGFRSRWFDFEKNEWKEEEEISAGEARQLVAALKPDSGIAKQSAVASRVGADRKAGRGSVTVLGSFLAQAGGKCRVSGARPGIDGTYLIESVQHEMSRGSSGFRSKLSLRKPEAGAGKDSRVPIPTPRPG